MRVGDRVRFLFCGGGWRECFVPAPVLTNDGIIFRYVCMRKKRRRDNYSGIMSAERDSARICLAGGAQVTIYICAGEKFLGWERCPKGFASEPLLVASCWWLDGDFFGRCQWGLDQGRKADVGVSE